MQCPGLQGMPSTSCCPAEANPWIPAGAGPPLMPGRKTHGKDLEGTHTVIRDSADEVRIASKLLYKAKAAELSPPEHNGLLQGPCDQPGRGRAGMRIAYVGLPFPNPHISRRIDPRILRASTKAQPGCVYTFPCHLRTLCYNEGPSSAFGTQDRYPPLVRPWWRCPRITLLRSAIEPPAHHRSQISVRPTSSSLASRPRLPPAMHPLPSPTSMEGCNRIEAACRIVGAAAEHAGNGASAQARCALLLVSALCIRGSPSRV